MLYLISLGLSDEKDMSLKALEIAMQCDSLYAEFYTTKMDTTPEKISFLVGKEVKEIKRKDLEELSHKLIEESKDKKVGVFVGGDALTATTHISILQEARKKGIATKVIHGSSILTAVAESGLNLYNFGKATTVVYPEKNYNPTTFYDTIAENKRAGLHTLVLLDVKAEENRCMRVAEALEILRKIDSKKILQDKIVSMSALGSDSQIIKYDSAENLIKSKTSEPSVLIFPGKLHFMEKEFLASV